MRIQPPVFPLPFEPLNAKPGAVAVIHIIAMRSDVLLLLLLMLLRQIANCIYRVHALGNQLRCRHNTNLLLLLRVKCYG